jgi:hypothetical protein
MRVADPRLFHFSELGNIEQFSPRPVEVPSPREVGEEWLNGPLVWATDEEHQATYLFPRDCPRILVWQTTATTEEDKQLWYGERDSSMIAHVEWKWLRRIHDSSLFRYELPLESLQDIEDGWMWVSREVVTPVRVERIDDLLGALRDLDVELRVMNTLAPLRQLWATSLHVSGIRLRNATGWSAD